MSQSMSFEQNTKMHAVYLPFVLLALIATLAFVWKHWGQSATILLLTIVLALMIIRDFTNR